MIAREKVCEAGLLTKNTHLLTNNIKTKMGQNFYPKSAIF